MRKKVVVLSGAGISAESGLQTFRGGNGLWNGYDVMRVASPEGWASDMNLVLEFYNMRRREIAQAKPNAGHIALAALESDFDVHIVTQNIDGLHEMAGSSQVMHLHGEIVQARSTSNPALIVDIGFNDIKPGDSCSEGSQLRPNIVWFGEAVPMISKAALLCSKADIFIVVGTSLQVYPAAGLIDYVPMGATKYIVDPEIPQSAYTTHYTHISKTASQGLPKLVSKLLGEKK